MKINSIKRSDYKYINFQGNKINLIVEKLSSRNFYTKPSADEFKELQNLYNNLYKELSLPTNLKPRIQYKAMFANMSFSLENYIINIQKNLSPFKMNVRNKTGSNIASLRHEIEHLKQFWEIIRLQGAYGAAKLFKRHKICEVKPSLLKKMKEIEQTLGRISPDSKEGKTAQLYIDALIKYPDLKTYYGILSLKELKNFIQYKRNFLEKNARLTENEYKPSLLKVIKITIQEFVKLISK